MVMRDSSGNLFVYKENKARSSVFSQTANVFLSLRPNSRVIWSFHNLLKGFAPVEMQQMFPWHPSGPRDPVACHTVKGFSFLTVSACPRSGGRAPMPYAWLGYGATGELIQSPGIKNKHSSLSHPESVLTTGLITKASRRDLVCVPVFVFWREKDIDIRPRFISSCFPMHVRVLSMAPHTFPLKQTTCVSDQWYQPQRETRIKTIN